MDINIKSVLQQVTSSAKRKIEGKLITINDEVDSAIPVCLAGKQLLLTHVLHGLIDDAVDNIIKGRITIKAKLFNTDKQNVVIEFLVAYSGATLTLLPDSSIDKNIDSSTVSKLKKLVVSQGGSFEEASASGLGKQYRFSQKFSYEEAFLPVLNSYEPSFIEALWSLKKMFSYPHVRKAIN